MGTALDFVTVVNRAYDAVLSAVVMAPQSAYSIAPLTVRQGNAIKCCLSGEPIGRAFICLLGYLLA